MCKYCWYCLVAMCVNDILAQGGEPYSSRLFATSKLDITQAADVLRGIAKGCKIAGCALVGGETQTSRIL